MEKCIICKSTNIAEILYGYPEDMDDFSKKIDSGKFALGGCTIGDNDPKWECKDCRGRW